MISIKKYLDADGNEVPESEPEYDQLSAAAMECYRAALNSIGKNAVRILPALGVDLEANLKGLERLDSKYSPDSVRRTEKQVEVALDEWGTRTSRHFKNQSEEVKELLIALAKTAESLGSRDKGYSTKFRELTGRLERIGDLSDLTQIRSALVERVTELKCSVDLMTRENQQLVANLREEVSTYETKLKVAEHLALKDKLTNLANRRCVEERLQSQIESGQEFCVAMIDINNFKQVNDSYGHNMGDDLLMQFAKELHSSKRAGDLVGRWGGDEFILVMPCDLQATQASIDRTRQWVCGKYTISGEGSAPVVVHVTASIGTAAWHSGESMQHLIAEADKAMYRDKKIVRQEAR